MSGDHHGTDETLLPDVASPPPVRLLPGSVVAHYEIQGLLGSGGMGSVYRARDKRIGRTVAIKLKKASAEGQTSCRLFCNLLMREGQAMGQLAHPNVLAVYDVGLVRGCVYLAIEYVEGTTLREWALGERTLEERLATLVDAGRGLAAAHGAGVVHRDFKPDNVLVGSGAVKVADFGLARTQAQILDWGVSCGGCASEDAERELLRSVDNEMAGTPRYMAPEQHDGEPATERSDVFAFGVTAWEVLCGAYPFVASTVGELRAAIAAGRTSAPVRDVPTPILAAIGRAIAGDPRVRPESMNALLASLAPKE